MEKKRIGFLWGLMLLLLLSIPISFADKKEPKVVYPGKTQLDFEGAQIEGELKNPGEFYFQHKPNDKFDSLVKRRKNFHKEMLRDVVLSK